MNMASTTALQTGHIEHVRVDKGFGFIRPDDAERGAKGIFFHATGLTPPLEMEESLLEMRVSFVVIGEVTRLIKFGWASGPSPFGPRLTDYAESG